MFFPLRTDSSRRKILCQPQERLREIRSHNKFGRVSWNRLLSHGVWN